MEQYFNWIPWQNESFLPLSYKFLGILMLYDVSMDAQQRQSPVPSVFLFKAQKTIVFIIGSIALTAAAYFLITMFKYNNPELAIYSGIVFTAIALLNYLTFEFYITASSITFCSHNTLFSRKVIPLKMVSGYAFDKSQSFGWVEIRAEIYDFQNNIVVSFVIGNQDSDFVEVMQKLNIPRRGELPKKTSINA